MSSLCLTRIFYLILKDTSFFNKEKWNLKIATQQMKRVILLLQGKKSTLVSNVKTFQKLSISTKITFVCVQLVLMVEAVKLSRNKQIHSIQKVPQ